MNNKKTSYSSEKLKSLVLGSALDMDLRKIFSINRFRDTKNI